MFNKRQVGILTFLVIIVSKFQSCVENQHILFNFACDYYLWQPNFHSEI
jgi:hypothetical protein